MTLSELYQQIKFIGYQFNTWDIPLNKEVHLEIKQRGPSEWYVEVNVKDSNE